MEQREVSAEVNGRGGGNGGHQQSSSQYATPIKPTGLYQDPTMNRSQKSNQTMRSSNIKGSKVTSQPNLTQPQQKFVQKTLMLFLSQVVLHPIKFAATPRLLDWLLMLWLRVYPLRRFVMAPKF
jgi:hypothetical protein